MGAKGSLSRKLARTLSKFTNYSPQCIIMLKEKRTPIIVIDLFLTQSRVLTAAGPLCTPRDHV